MQLRVCVCVWFLLASLLLFIIIFYLRICDCLYFGLSCLVQEKMKDKVDMILKHNINVFVNRYCLV